MIPLSRLRQTLTRNIVAASDVPFDRNHTYGTATVAWLTASFLQQYIQAHQDALDRDRITLAVRALDNVRREMNWLQVCGNQAETRDITNSVAHAVLNVWCATTLLEGDKRPGPPSLSSSYN